MPGRFLDVLKGVTRSESFKSQKSDASSSRGSKKVSFDSKVKDKQLKSRKNRKQRLPSIRPLKAVRGDHGKHKSGDRAASSEFWFNAHRPPQAPQQQSRDGPYPLGGSTSPPNSSGKTSPTMPYQYEQEAGLHPSQKPSEVPRVKRHLVRNIVAQFNEEAQRRNQRRYASTEQLDDGRAMSPLLIEATPENAPNHSQPFSYTGRSQEALDASPRSKSSYDLQQTPPPSSDLIYAQVVVNGSGHATKGDGRYKTTVHTKVPNRAAAAVTKTTTTSSGGAFSDSKRLFSKSTGNLHRDDRLQDYQRKGKKTDNSYYKFDPVDDDASAAQNGKAEGGHQRARGKQLFRSSSTGVDSENNDPAFEPSRHQVIHLADAGGLLKKAGGAGGGYETRNVEKWSEREVGPNSRKFTEREFVHEVTMSDGGGSRSPQTNGQSLSRTLHEHKEDRTREKFYHSDRSSESAHVKKSRHRRADDETAKDDVDGQRNRKGRAFQKSSEAREKRMTSSTARWRSGKAAENGTVSSPDHTSKTSGLSQYYFGESSPRVSVSPPESRKQERRNYETEERSATSQKNTSGGKVKSNGFLSASSHQRRNSSDSGSGVGLLSSKLVKQANAEVNGYLDDSGDDAAFDEGKVSDRWLRSDRRHENGDFRLRRNDKFASTSWLNRNDSEPVIRDPFRRFDEAPLETSTPFDKYAGGVTTERRHFRKEETKRTTKRETRTSRPLPTVDYDYDSDAERLGIDQRHEERSDSRGSADRGQHRQQRLERSKTEDSGATYWRDGAEDTAPNRSFDEKTAAERKVNVGIRSKKTAVGSQRHHAGGAFGDEYEDKMETSESEPQLYSGSQDSHMSLGSRFSSAEEEEQLRHHVDEEEEEVADIIAEHVNTPQSMVKQMNKQQISYENSQQRHHHHETGRRFWFERSTDEVDDVRRSHTRLDKPDANSNHYVKHHNANNQRHHASSNNNNNHLWTSATMSRLETNKNRRNIRHEGALHHHRMANTMDHRGRKNGATNDVRIQLDGRDVSHDDALANGKRVDRSPSFSSRVGSYHSENESQHSGGSSSSAKKRVNFKSRGGSTGGGRRGVYSSNADLSPIHREALLRSASPARAPSTTGSMKSNDSDASHGSNRSVIIHKTVEADMSPARQYQVRSANTSPAPPPSVVSAGGGSRETHTVQRSFSLLSPWKPRKYKDKYEKREVEVLPPTRSGGGEMENGRRRSSYHEEQQRHLAKHQHKNGQDGEAVSHNSSSERLDSLSPLPSEGPTTKTKAKKKTGLFRRHSMPKDSRFANFFRRKKDAAKS